MSGNDWTWEKTYGERRRKSVTGCFLIVSLSTILAADFQNTIVNNFSV